MKPLKEEIQQTKPFVSIEEEVYLNLLKTADSLRSEIEKTLGIMGLNHNQYNVLRILRGSHPLGLATEEISERMITKETDFANLLGNLESRGLITLAADERNLHPIIGKITNQGLDLLLTLDVSVNEKVVSLLNFLGLDLMDQFNALLVLARKNVSKD